MTDSAVLLGASLVGSWTTAEVLSFPRHTLTLSAVSWSAVLVLALVRRRKESGGAGGTGGGGGSGGGLREDVSRRKSCLVAGSAWVLGLICERAVGSGERVWWANALLPLAILVPRWVDVDPRKAASSSTSPGDRFARHGSKRLLLVVTAAALIVLLRPFVDAETIALGVCRAFFMAGAYNFLDDALNAEIDEKSMGGGGGFVSADGSLSRIRPLIPATEASVFVTVMRDVSAVAALGSAMGAIVFETFRVDALAYEHSLGIMVGAHWKVAQWWINFARAIGLAGLGAVNAYLVMLMLRRKGSLHVGFAELGSALVAHLVTDGGLASGYFSLLAGAGIAAYITDPACASYVANESRRTMRRRQLLVLFSIFSFLAWGMYALQGSSSQSRFLPDGSAVFRFGNPSKPLDAVRPADSHAHPIDQLVTEAEKDFDRIQSKQSQTLDQAVAEYRRRYGIPPPPNFDKWFEFAKQRDVQLIDEYDTIYHSLLPFWALDPAIIRARTREALGFDNALMGVSIRNGQSVLVEKGPEWQQKATVGFLNPFVNHLPDMDIAFNLHDEPRVVVPHDELERLVSQAKQTGMAPATGNRAPRNGFSGRPEDMNDGQRMEPFHVTRFNKYAHQPTWLPSRLSCPANSPARAVTETAKDNVTSWALGELGFVYNTTAFSDICQSPSLRQTFGFFDRPNAFNLVHDLFPIFSQSKVSSYQDILYPSPWYWYGKVSYDSDRDMDWEAKATNMWWRGSTTGGFSRDGGWRRQHRQHVVKRINAPDQALILEKPTSSGGKGWQTKQVSRTDYKDLFDVKFSHVGQCDADDCNAQKEVFDIAEPADQQDAWGFKYLLDMDGNAFSGRFYAFLKSKSLVYKLALFREWHSEWLRPWVHYVPLSLRGDEFVEGVRYFVHESAGEAQGPRIAQQGRDWAGKVLRNEDFEAWFFRMLLEYGRVIDDKRDEIGFTGE